MLAVAVLALLFVPAAAAAAAGWRWPVTGDVVGRFAIGPDPFAAGQRRGIDLATSAGAVAVAPCSGRVSFAGRLPRGGAGVSIRCGALTATVLGLAAPSVRSGSAVASGQAVGVVGPGGRVRLGARRTASRFGYVDPLALVGAPRQRRHVPPAGPVGRRARPGTYRSRPTLPAPGTAPAAVPVPVAAAPVRAPDGPRVPLAAWIGVALLALAVPGGAVAGRACRRRRAGPAARVAG